MTHEDKVRLLRDLALAVKAPLGVGGDGGASMHLTLVSAGPDDVEPWLVAALASGATLTVLSVPTKPGATWLYLSLAAPVVVEAAATEAA